MNMTRILLLCSVLAKTFNKQVIEDIEEFIKQDGNFGSHTANIDDIRDTFKSCVFFIFRHHRSLPDQYERSIKSAENAFLLETIKAIEDNKLSGKMNVVVKNYEEEVRRCEPILLSNVLTVEEHYENAKVYYDDMKSGSRKDAVDEALYLRMRNFERAADGAKRLIKSKAKGYSTDFAWQTSLSEEYRNRDDEKIQKYIKDNFPSGPPKLLQPFKTIFEKYTPEILKEMKDGKALQLVKYFFYGKDLGVLDRSQWPADPKQADQMKRWLLRGQEKPSVIAEFPKLEKLLEEMVGVLQKKGNSKLPNSWFNDLVVARQQKEQQLIDAGGIIFEGDSTVYNISMLSMLALVF